MWGYSNHVKQNPMMDRMFVLNRKMGKDIGNALKRFTITGLRAHLVTLFGSLFIGMRLRSNFFCLVIFSCH